MLPPPAAAQNALDPGVLDSAPTQGVGEGIKVFADGSRYEGQWKDGQKHGKGKYIYADGELYEGQWYQGKAHGEGTNVSKQSAPGALLDSEL